MMNQLNRKNIINGLKLTLAISIIVSVVVLIWTMDIEELKKMTHVRPEYLGLAFVVLLAMILTQGLRLKILARALDTTLSMKEGIKNYLVGAFVANVTPFSSGGGPVQVLFLQKQVGMSFGGASSIIIVQWLLRQIIFGILAPIFYLTSSELIDPGKIPTRLFELAVGGSVALTVGLLFFVWKPQVIPVLAKGIARFPGIKGLLENNEKYRLKFNELIDWAYHEIEVFHESLWTLAIRKKWEMFLTTLFTVVFWTLYFLVAPVILLGLGAEPHFGRALLMQTIMFLILPYVPTPGATGAAEIGFAAFFAPFVPFHLLGIVMVSWRFMTFYLLILLGSATTLKMLNE